MFLANSFSCMHFVGGNHPNGKSGNYDGMGSEYAGGCTPEWWELQMTRSADTYGAIGSVSKPGDADFTPLGQAAMNKLMQPDGSPILTWYTSSITFAEDEYPITVFASAGTFSVVEIGMAVYAHCCNSVYDDQVLEGTQGLCLVTDVSETGHSITFTGQGNGNTGPLEIKVGGSRLNLDSFCKNQMDTLSHSQEVWVNRDIVHYGPWDLSLWKDDTYALEVKGFNKVPGDITEVGGEFYQSVLDVYKNGGVADPNCFVNIDQSGMGFGNMMTFEASRRIRLKGFNLHDANSPFGYMVHFGSDSVQSCLEHCVVYAPLSQEVIGFEDYESNESLIDCCITGGVQRTIQISKSPTIRDSFIIASPTGYQMIAAGTDAFPRFDNCVLDGNGVDFISQANKVNMSFDKCLVIGGSSGIFSSSWNESNTCYRLTNTILLVQDKSHYIVTGSYSNAKHILVNLSHCCCYSLDGNPLDELFYAPPGGTMPAFVEGLVEEDPQLDSDYIPRNKAVLLGGTRDVAGNKSTVGAVSQEHQFVSRSANSNPGRLGIIR